MLLCYYTLCYYTRTQKDNPPTRRTQTMVFRTRRVEVEIQFGLGGHLFVRHPWLGRFFSGGELFWSREDGWVF